MTDENINNDLNSTEPEGIFNESSDVGIQSLTDALKKSFVVRLVYNGDFCLDWKTYFFGTFVECIIFNL